MKLYFGNTVTTITTVMVLALLGFIGYSVWSRASILYWGRRTAFLFAFGLVICCFAATRDGLDKTVQCAIDGSCAPGLFALVSIPTIIGCIGAFLILLAAIATPIVKTQQMRQFWFYLINCSVRCLGSHCALFCNFRNFQNKKAPSLKFEKRHLAQGTWHYFYYYSIVSRCRQTVYR